MGSNITTTGSLNEVTVDGITDTNLISKDIIVSLSGDKFKNIAKDTDVTSWFKNIPLGLNAKVKEEVSLNATSLTVTLSGFPTQAQKSSVWIEIPKEVLQSTTYDVTIINKTTKFEIVSGTPVDIPSAITGLVYNDEEQKGIPENRAYTIEKGTGKNAGTYEARLILNKGYKWSDGTVDPKEVSWTISRLPIEVELTLKKDIFEYTGYEIKPEYEIVKKGSSLNINFSEYEITYENNINIGENTASTSIKYRSGTTVTVKVSIPIGKSFVRWIFEGITLSSEEVKKEEISFEMPENDITLTAIFDDVLYNITITNGKVNGELTQVKYQDDITALANEPETDKMFDKWIVTGISLTDEDLFNPNITFKMPSNDVVLEATYKDIPKYDVTVSGGSGAGKYKEGEAVTIVSEEKEGFSFDKWIVTGITLKDDELSSSIITFIMPAYYVVLEATYTKNITPEVKYKVIIVDGISSISESENGKTITIKANEAPKGFVFDKWVVISGNVKLEDQNNKETSFVKASEDVEIKATYRTKDSSGDDKPGEDKPGDDKPGENKGLSGGAIAGIVIGSVFACGIGGFSLVWFVIKKKSFADLGNSIKSIFNKIKSLFKKGKE